MRFATSHPQQRRRLRGWFFVMMFICCVAPMVLVRAQDTQSEPVVANPETKAVEAAPPAAVTTSKKSVALPSVWDLAVQGGIFMVPIAICSIVVAAFGIERWMALRTTKIAPPELIARLHALSTEEKGIDPRQAYEVCREFPSPLARIIEMGILKVGRPHSELEKAVEDSAAREADDMAGNIKPINTAAVLGPQLGLIGTVQGMIMAFMVTSTTTATGAAKGQELAAGIYTALVTTFAGLCVSIPAIIVATLLESRIERLLRGMENVFDHVLPQFERFEGKYRVALNSDASGVVLKGTAAKPVGGKTTTESATSTTSATPKSLWGVMGSKAE